MLQRNGVGVKVVTIAVVAGVAVLLLPYVSGLLGAGVLYVIAAPLVHRRDRGDRGDRGGCGGGRGRWAALLAVLALFAIIVLPGAWVVARLLAQLPDAVQSIQQSAAVQRLMAVRMGELDIGTHLRDAASEIITWSSRQTLAAIGSMMDVTLNLVIALFGAYYLLLAADRLWDRTRAALPFASSTTERLRVRFHRTTEAMLLGVVLTGVVQGTVVGVAFAIIGLPHPLLWGAVTAFASVLPMFGSALVWLPGSLVLMAQQRYGAAALLAILGALLVSNLDNALRLVVYRRVSQIHPMVTLVGAFAGVRAFGIAGILLGPLVLSYAIELLLAQQDAAVAALEPAA
jgi:predicted PurR-regulated permease PerM